MYTSNSINPPVNNHLNNGVKNPYLNNRPAGFAIIQVRHPEPITSNTLDVPLQSYASEKLNTMPVTNRHDIEKIITILKTQTPKNNDATLPQEPLDIKPPIPQKPVGENFAETIQSYITSIDDKTALGVTAGLGGVVTGMLLHSKLGTQTPIAKDTLSKNEIANSIIKMMPDIIKSVATGTTMVAAAVGLSSWLNQETPERLKARLEAAKG